MNKKVLGGAVGAVVLTGAIWAYLLRSDDAQEVVSSFSVGTANLVEVACAPGGQSGATCYAGDVIVEGVSVDKFATVKYKAGVGENKGTLLLMTGGGGGQLYDRFAFGTPMVDELNDAGYATAQVQWNDNPPPPGRPGWIGGVDGWIKHSERCSTVFRWVYDNLHEGAEDTGFCITGNSGGSAQVSYVMAHQGMGDIVDLAMPTSGPPSGRIDIGCSCSSGDSVGDIDGLTCANPNEHNLCMDGGAEAVMDSAFAGTPCADLTQDNLDPDILELLHNESAVSPLGTYDYPTTKVFIVFGDEDQGFIIAQGTQYLDAITSEKETTCIPNVGHGIAKTLAGKDVLVAIVIEDCHPRGVASCEGDVNGDGLVDPLDSGFVLARFGCEVGAGNEQCDSADLNGDGLVDPLDQGFVLSRFGPC